MNTETYTILRQALLEKASEIENAKRPSYTVGSDDVLANFKRVGERIGLSANQVALVYFLKHVDSISASASGIKDPEELEGRFCDAINYLCLLWALMCEKDPAVKWQPLEGLDPPPGFEPGVAGYDPNIREPRWAWDRRVNKLMDEVAATPVCDPEVGCGCPEPEAGEPPSQPGTVPVITDERVVVTHPVCPWCRTRNDFVGVGPGQRTVVKCWKCRLAMAITPNPSNPLAYTTERAK